MEAELRKKLKDTFGHDDFMSNDQKECTEEVFRGKRDVYISLQPGAGKSICFQLPAVLNENSLTVVFVPTNCLGEVQVDFLKQRNINAEYLCPATLPKLRNKILDDSRADKMKLRLLYASTDKGIRDFVIEFITDLYNRKALSFLVFDEAQCISHFSNDYASNYREVADSVKRLFPSIRKIVLTGTATYEVKNDIFKILDIKNPRVIFSSSLFVKYEDVRFIDSLQDPLQDLRNFINKCMGPSEQQCPPNQRSYGIIFCRKKQAAKKIERQLRAMDIPVVSCHGDLSSRERKSILSRWISGEIAVIAVTPQFALGLHRPNVRFIVHWSLPMSIQQLYQGNGRTAQNGGKTRCRVYFSIEEENSVMMHIKSLPRGSTEEADISSRKHRFFNEFVDYCFGTECRIVAQMACFGHIVARCNSYCDACCDLENLKKRINAFLCIRSRTKRLLAAQVPDKRIPPSREGSDMHWAYVSCMRKTQVVFATPKARERSYNRLLDELTQNYNEARAEIKEKIEIDDIPEIARQLEYSVFMDASNSQKYNHDIVQTIRVIRKSKASKVACGYLRYYVTAPKSVRYGKPEIINIDDDDEDDERTRPRVAKIEVVDLDETTSGSETA